MVNNKPQEEYFVIQDLGYDGWVINKYPTYETAINAYNDSIKYDKELKEKYPDIPLMPIFLIKGKILEHIGEL